MLYLFNTLVHQTEIFKPLKKKRVGLYTCGPTVYNYAHLGNLRTYIFEDILKRILIYNGYKVRHVMNITDVGHLTSDADDGEDKMEKGARREGRSAWEIAEFYIKAFKNDLRDLNILEPDIWCRATDHIKEQIKLVETLKAKGFTYETSDGIYFDTTKLPDYGKLAGLEQQELKAGTRVKIGEKKNPHDFALWKFSPTGQKRQMEWPAFGRQGFPGWHIECSAMSVKYLGQPFDIHCGGIDHVPVHHTNEIAQSEAAAGKPLANYWLHGEFLLTGDAKMAKSESNFLTLDALKNREVAPLAYRYLLLQTHYRKQLNFTWEALAGAQNALNNLYSIVRSLPLLSKERTKVRLPFAEKFQEAINHDLNLPQALSILWKTVHSPLPAGEKSALILKFDKILGLDIKKYLGKKIKIPTAVKKLLAERKSARENKDWKKSDDLREEIKKLGFAVEDAKNKQIIKPA